MSFFDNISNGSQYIVNTTIGETRSNVNRQLTGLLMSKVPSLNRIPGVAGNVINNAVGTLIGDGVREIMGVLNVPLDSAVRRTNPQIYNNGVTAAQGVWTELRNGNTNVPQMVGQAQEPLTLLSYTHQTLPPLNPDGSIHVTPHYPPYAMDLFKLAPKHKFLFVVEFVFNGGYDFIGNGTHRRNEFALVIKEFDRPKIKYEYDEANYYNFRTKIVKRVVHDPLTIKFYDDRQNLAMKFFHEYMKMTHPLTNVAPGSAAFYEQNGMNFDNKSLNSGSFTSLPDNNARILKEIKVYHVYDFGTTMNLYHFTNPKIVSISLDDWAMHESEGNTIVGEFAYDGLFMDLGVPIDRDGSSIITTLSNSGQYPMRPNTNGTDGAQPSVPQTAEGTPVSAAPNDSPIII